MSRRGSLRAILASLVGIFLTACEPTARSPDPTPAPEGAQKDSVARSGLQGQVDQVRAEHNLIALGAVSASSDGILEIAVSGERARGSGDPVQVSDMWHLGSNTKALTALLYATVVERDLAKWQATLPELFPQLADEMDPAWQEITIEDLFAHRSGLQQLGGFWLNARRNDERPVTVQRADTVQTVLTKPPSGSPDEFDYNNLNYILAGAAIETILASENDLPNTWEEAMQVMVFDALEPQSLRTQFGYGPPPAGLQGHRGILGAFFNPVGRGKSADNPQAMGPAGTLHASLEAHAALALEFLKDDSEIVPVEMREKLFAPHPDENSGYAMGWGVHDDPKYGRLYLHNGSNTMWTSSIIIAPALDRVVIANTNQFSAAAREALQSICRQMLDDALSARDPQ